MAATARAAAVAATRACSTRLSNGRLAPGRPLLIYRTQQQAVLGALSEAFALTASARAARGLSTEPTDATCPSPGIPGMTFSPWAAVNPSLALYKALTVRGARRVATVCMHRLGLPGLMDVNAFHAYLGLAQAFESAGGDNQLIFLDTGQRLIAEPKLPLGETMRPQRTQFDDPWWWQPIVEALQHLLCEELRQVMNRRANAGLCGLDLWNPLLHRTRLLGEVHAQNLLARDVAETLDCVTDPCLRTVLCDLAALHAVQQAQQLAGILMETRLLSIAAVRGLPCDRGRLVRPATAPSAPAHTGHGPPTGAGITPAGPRQLYRLAGGPAHLVPRRTGMTRHTPPPIIGVLGLGTYLPRARRTNAEGRRHPRHNPGVDHRADARSASPARRRLPGGRLGSRKRRGVPAAAAAGIAPRRSGILISATSTPDGLGPATACRVQARVNARNAVAFDVSAACSGWLFGTRVAHDWLRGDPTAHYAAVVGVETYSKFLDPSDRGTAVLFGDGAAAAVLGPVTDGGFTSFHLGSDRNEHTMYSSPQAAAATPRPTGPLREGAHNVHMDGRAVRGLITDVFPCLVEDALKSSRLELTDLDLIVTHQPNPVLLRDLGQRIGIPLRPPRHRRRRGGQHRCRQRALRPGGRRRPRHASPR